nr:hypothetical protein [Tanacetum cinerariifolium]
MRQIRPTLTIVDKRRVDDKLIGILRRERRYFRTLATTYAREDAHSHDYCTRIMDYYQSREVHTRTLVTQIEALQRDVTTLQRQHIEHAQRDVAPEDGDSCHYKRNCSRLGNRNQGNQNLVGNENDVARAYAVDTAGRNPEANVVT